MDKRSEYVLILKYINLILLFKIFNDAISKALNPSHSLLG